MHCWIYFANILFRMFACLVMNKSGLMFIIAKRGKQYPSGGEKQTKLWCHMLCNVIQLFKIRVSFTKVELAMIYS